MILGLLIALAFYFFLHFLPAYTEIKTQQKIDADRYGR